jgi:hypothetical protein
VGEGWKERRLGKGRAEEGAEERRANLQCSVVHIELTKDVKVVCFLLVPPGGDICSGRLI